MGAFGAILLIIGCDELRPVPTATEHAGVALTKEHSVRAEEAHLHAIANRVPGFGGYGVGNDGVMTVWTGKNTAPGEAARVVRASIADRARLSGSNPQLPSMRERRSRFDFQALARWRDSITLGELGRWRGLVEVDLNEAENRIDLGFLETAIEAARRDVRSRLSSYGVDPQAVHIFATHQASIGRGISTPARLSTGPTLREPAFPFVGGHQIALEGPPLGGYCTAGVVVERNGVRGVVSNSHCSATTYGLDVGYSIGNAYHLTYPLGFETVDPNAESCEILNSGFTVPCRDSDAAFFQLYEGVASRRGAIARTASYVNGWGVSGSIDVSASNPFFAILTTAAAGTVQQGHYLMKMGRTTGWSGGQVVSTCVDVIATDGRMRKCSGKATYLSDGGDSGSPVFTVSNYDGAHLIGLTWGGSQGDQRSYFSYWSDVIQELGGNIVATTDISVGAPSATGSISGARPRVSWSAVSTTNTVNATVYHLRRSTYSHLLGGFTEQSVPVASGASLSTFRDVGTVVDVYYGTGAPPSGVDYVEYHVLAVNNGVANSSATLRFRLTGAQ